MGFFLRGGDVQRKHPSGAVAMGTSPPRNCQRKKSFVVSDGSVARYTIYELRISYRTSALTDMFPGYTKSHLLLGHQICVICEICVRIFPKGDQ